tara:strand:- start:420 stop:611 length:192 start_codon:yes stop_codon:yes gene_type:complete
MPYLKANQSAGFVKCKLCDWKHAMYKKGPFRSSAWHVLERHYEEKHEDELNVILEQLGQPAYE